jgi:hypothetical protein
MGEKPDDGSRRSDNPRRNFFLSVNYFTPVDRFLTDAAERGRIGRPSDECPLKRGTACIQ